MIIIKTANGDRFINESEAQSVTHNKEYGYVVITFKDGHSETQPFSEIVEQSRLYILTVGGFERFAEWGLIRHKDV